MTKQERIQAVINAERSFINNVFKNRHNWTRVDRDPYDIIKKAVSVVRYYEGK